MKRTLVLAVDRDDDFGVKGKVTTPVIGLEACISAANSLGIADPEDSDLNAIYAAISTCMDLQEEGLDAEVALICGDEKVGHKSDLTVAAQLESVLDQLQPDNVVLVGDGAEDEYIYPIISSRAHVDSVRRVYVKQAQNIESSFYIITKMLSEPNKRRRFVAPIGAIVFLVSLFLLLPDLAILITSGDVNKFANISRDLVLLIVGVALLMYAYSFSDKWSSFSTFFKDRILSRGTRMVMIALAIGILAISAIVCYYEVIDTYYPSWVAMVVTYVSHMVWPVIMAIVAYILGIIMDEAQEDSVIRLSNLFACLSLASLGVMITGIFDLALYYVGPVTDPIVGLTEVFLGVVLSIAFSYFKNQFRPKVAG